MNKFFRVGWSTVERRTWSLKVNGVHSANCGNWWLLLMLHPPAHSTQTLSPRVPHGKGFIAPGRCIKGPMNFDLGLDYPGNTGHEQWCFKRPCLQCLNVFHSKDVSLWDLVKSGRTFCDVPIPNKSSIYKNTSAAPSSMSFVFVANLWTFASLEPWH